MSDIELTSEQTEKILQFQDLTRIDDLSLCRDTLHRHGWDLEAAIQDQLNIKEGRPSVFSSDLNPPVVVNDVRGQVVYSPPTVAAPWGWNYGGPIGFAASLIFRMIYDAFTSVIRCFTRFIFPPPRYPLTDPSGDVLRHIQYLENTYSGVHPVFYRGTYGQALNDAKHELLFLIVHLHSLNQESDEFYRNNLVHQEVVDLINNSNALFWTCTINSGEGQRVASVLSVATTPFIGVVVLHENKMVLVARFSGNMTKQSFSTRLQQVLDVHLTSLVVARTDRMERSMNQSLRAQQDEAYMASLKADQEKQRKKQELAQKQEQEDQLKLKLIEDEKLRKLNLLKQKEELAAKVSPEPSAHSSDAIRILFKFPNADRVERRFLKTDTMQNLYNFVYSHPGLSEQFEVYTNFPKRNLVCTADSTMTLVEAGLLSKEEVLFVYDLES